MQSPTLRSGIAVACLVFASLFLAFNYVPRPAAGGSSLRPAAPPDPPADSATPRLRVLYTRSDDADGPSPIEKKLLQQLTTKRQKDSAKSWRVSLLGNWKISFPMKVQR